MAETIRPFDTPGTYFHNYTLDKIMPALSPNAWKVLCVAIRQTWGWVDKDSPTGRKQSDVISYSQFMEKTGIGGRSTLSRVLSECLEAGYLIRSQVGVHQGTRRPIYAYSLNTDYEVASPEMGLAESSGPKTGPEEVASPEMGPAEIASPKTGPAASPETGPAEIASPETGLATSPEMGPAASPKTGLTKEKETKQTNNGGDGEDDLAEEDKRINLLVNLAQDLRQPLDLGRANAMVQPYDVGQVEDLVTYTRRAKSLRDPLAFVFKRLKTGELPILPPPAAEPVYDYDVYREEGEAIVAEPSDPALAEGRRLWQAVVEELKLQMTHDTFVTWIQPTRVVAGARSTSPSAGSGRGSRQAHGVPFDEARSTSSRQAHGVPFDEARSTSSRQAHGVPFDGTHGVLCVEVENVYVKEWLSNRLMETIRRTVNSISGETMEIEFVVKEEQHAIEGVGVR